MNSVTEFKNLASCHDMKNAIAMVNTYLNSIEFKDTSYAWAKYEHPLDVLLHNFVNPFAALACKYFLAHT